LSTKDILNRKEIILKKHLALVACLEAIRMFLAFSNFREFKLYEMDVKSTFFNGDLEEDFFIDPHEGFILVN